MKLYKVRATDTWEYVIEVGEHETPEDIAKIVSECSREYDSNGPTISVVQEIKSREQLPHGWDATCLPYGSDFDREVWIGQILDEDK